jgi:hypothetical protein
MIAKYPTKFYLGLSSLVYLDQFESLISKVIPNKFSLLLSSTSLFSEGDDYGYKGLAFFDNKSKELVISNCGTSIDKLFEDQTDLLGDIASDIDLIHQNVPEQFYKATVPFVEKALDKIQEMGHSKMDCKIIFTGHSLGASLSEILGAYYHKQGYDINACVFDSPGTKPIIEKEFGVEVASQIKDKVIIHNATPNAINTLNPQVGVVYQLHYTDWFNSIRNVFHNEYMYTFIKVVYNLMIPGANSDAVWGFGNFLSTHRLSAFEKEIGENGEFKKEVRVDNWNEILGRSFIAQELSKSEIINALFNKNQEDILDNTNIGAISTGKGISEWISWAVDEIAEEYMDSIGADNYI